MTIKAVTIVLRADWVHSLKEKRSELKSIIQKVRNKFNVSVAETGQQDVHQTMVITVACVAATQALADSILSQVIRFVEANTDAEMVQVEAYE